MRRTILQRQSERFRYQAGKLNGRTNAAIDVTNTVGAKDDSSQHLHDELDTTIVEVWVQLTQICLPLGGEKRTEEELGPNKRDLLCVTP